MMKISSRDKVKLALFSHVLRQNDWDRSRAAVELRVSLGTVKSFCKKYRHTFPYEVLVKWNSNEKFPENKILDSLARNKYSSKKASEDLGISCSTVGRCFRKRKHEIPPELLPVFDAAKQITDDQVLEALEECQWNKSRAARQLKVSRHIFSELCKNRSDLFPPEVFKRRDQVPAISKTQMMEALKKNDWDKSKTAQELNLTIGWVQKFCSKHRHEFPVDVLEQWDSRRRVSKTKMVEALERHEWNKVRAARELGISLLRAEVFCSQNGRLFPVDVLEQWKKENREALKSPYQCTKENRKSRHLIGVRRELCQVFRELHADELASGKGAGA
jgi:hypothetical protein